MQETIDGCGKGYSTQAAIKNLWGHLDRFALEMDIINRCFSELRLLIPFQKQAAFRSPTMKSKRCGNISLILGLILF